MVKSEWDFIKIFFLSIGHSNIIGFRVPQVKFDPVITNFTKCSGDYKQKFNTTPPSSL